MPRTIIARLLEERGQILAIGAHDGLSSRLERVGCTMSIGSHYRRRQVNKDKEAIKTRLKRWMGCIMNEGSAARGRFLRQESIGWPVPMTTLESSRQLSPTSKA